MNPLLIILLVVAFFYFFVMRPQKKREQETNALRNNLRVGDEITTIDGIIGEIISIKGETVMIETAKARSKIRILRRAISTVDVHAEDK